MEATPKNELGPHMRHCCEELPSQSWRTRSSPRKCGQNLKNESENRNESCVSLRCSHILNYKSGRSYECKSTLVVYGNNNSTLATQGTPEKEENMFSPFWLAVKRTTWTWKQNRGKTWIFLRSSTRFRTLLEQPGKSGQDKIVTVGKIDIGMMGMMAIGDQLKLFLASQTHI